MVLGGNLSGFPWNLKILIHFFWAQICSQDSHGIVCAVLSPGLNCISKDLVASEGGSLEAVSLGQLVNKR